jgi:hypothetical protein
MRLARPWLVTPLRLGALSLVAVVALLGPARDAAAQTYRYTDDAGQTYYTQGLENVPARYRSRAVLVSPAAPPAQPSAPASQPAPARPSPSAQIRFTPGQPIVVSARINDLGTVRLMLDTGASVTTINPAALSGLGISYRDAQRAVIRGVTGDANTLAVRVQSIEVAGLRHGPMIVLSHDSNLGLGTDGLLGRDFLDNFVVNIDNSAGVVTLAPK